jgi:uncharacterized protein YydD (DUF2326 family)
MLRRLSAEDRRFRGVTFQRGLNLLVAQTTSRSTAEDSRNGTGKSSLVELLHFLLGARTDRKSALSRPELRDIRFRLCLDWHDSAFDPLTVARRGVRPQTVLLDRTIEPSSQALFDTDGDVETPVGHWQRAIERHLFGLEGDHPGVSGRTLLSFLMRRVSGHAFNAPTRTYPQQSEPEATTNLAYLLGLDWRLAAQYQQIAGREAARRQLRKAVDDPVWGKIVGSTADLRGQITLAEREVRRLEEQITGFRVVPQYEDLRRRADEIDRRIRDFGAQDTIDQRNLNDLRAAVEETTDTEVQYLEPVYRELEVVLGEQVRRRFDDVQDFHASIVRNRRRYLSEEIRTLEERLSVRAAERARLGEELQSVLRTLNEGGALEALTALQQALAQKQASKEALQHRYEAAQTLEASSLEIRAQRIDLQRSLSADLAERQQQQDEATLLFSEFAQRLYGTGRQAYLVIDAATNSLKVEPRIDSDGSRGIGNMVTFCFDLTVAVIAHRHGRGPDFLVHDSHLFDGVDDRQIAAALGLAREVADREGLQYIATMNSDDLDKAERRGFDPGSAVLSPLLTDAYDDGGLFGFRF